MTKKKDVFIAYKKDREYLSLEEFLELIKDKKEFKYVDQNGHGQ